VDITTGAIQTYTLAGEIMGNFAFWPRATDSLANSLYGKEEVSSAPSKLQNHAYNPMKEFPLGWLGNIPRLVETISNSSLG